MKRIVKVQLGGSTRLVNLGAVGPATPGLSNVVPPWIVGALYAGQEVAAANGQWTLPPETFTYQWLRNGVPIGGATGPTYTLTVADIGAGSVAVRVIASRAGFDPAVATSAAVSVSIAVPFADLEELAPAVDVPTITFTPLAASAAPTFASSGFQREKRAGVAETPAGGVQSSTAALDLSGSSRFRYPGITGATGFSGNPGQYVATPLKPGGAVQSARELFTLDQETPVTDRYQVRLVAPVANPRFGLVLVNGRRVQLAPHIANGISAGAGYVATLTFPTAAARRIKIYGLNHNLGSFGGAAVPGAGVVKKPTNVIQRRVLIIGDSLGNGSSGVSPVETFVWDIARALGADEIIQFCIGGTGFVNDGGSPQGSNPDGVYINRVPAALSMDPHVLIILGGRNDSTAPSLASRVAEIMAATASVPERWVLSDSVISASNTIIRNGTLAAGAKFVDLSDYPSLVPLSDGIHPTLAGHRQLAQIAIDRMGLTVTDPDVLTPATGTPGTGLAWEMPTAAQIGDAGLDRHALVHYYAPQPGAFSNTSTDFYESGYLPVDGEGGIHASYGGWLRDRPGPPVRAPYPTSPVSWQRSMQAREIQAMIDGGVDGAFCNIMGSSGDNWNRYMWLLQEAEANFPGFRVVPMVDASYGMALNDTTEVAAARINTFLSSSARWLLPDGRYVVGTFKMEGKPLSYWTEVKGLLQSTHGKDTAWVGVYNNIGQATTYDPVQWAVGRWGPGADPAIANGLADIGPSVRSRGKKLLIPTWWQDVRYRSGIADESRNLESLRAYGDLLIRQEADITQICTWSDMTEASHFRPSVARGRVAMDVNSYRLTKWKTGKFPKILRDVVYLSHRNQTLGASVTGGQTMMLAPWDRGGAQSSPRDGVEVLTYLTAAAVVTVKSGSNVQTYTAPAGEWAQVVTALPGEVSVKVVRAGTEVARVNSPVVIRSTVVNQDRQYFAFSSLRGTTGQYDPTPGAPSPNPSNYVT